MMLKIRNAATCNWPTTKRPQRSPGTGNSGARNKSRAGASNATVPTRRSSTNTIGGVIPVGGDDGSGDLVDRDGLRDAAQFALLRHRPHAVCRQQIGRLRVIDDRSRRVDRAGIGQPLHARGDVDGMAEIILMVVE